MKQKILVILDHNYNKSRKVYNELVKTIIDLYGSRYEVVFKLFDPMQTYYEFIPQNIQSAIDSETVQTYTEDYACVIVDGPAAYFWLQSFYNGNLIAINPVIDIYTEYLYNDDDIKDLKFSRSFQTNNIICLLSNELKDSHEEYDNVFYDATVVVAKEDLSNIHSFWSKGSTFDQCFNYMIKQNDLNEI